MKGKANETEKAVKLAKQFCDWATAHHRHFNVDKVLDFIKYYEAVNVNHFTKSPYRSMDSFLAE